MMKALTCVAVVLGILVARGEPVAKTTKEAYEGARADLEQHDPEEAAKLQKLGVLSAQMVLAKLGYGIGQFDGVLDAKTQEGVREYERTRHLTVTGDPLSYDTWQHLAADNETYDYGPVYVPPGVFGAWFWNSGHFTASGTWSFSGGLQAVPEQTSKIDCDRQRGTCIEATAMLERSDPNTGLPTSGVSNDTNLSVDMDTYEIERWDEYEIVTKPHQFGCVRFELRFNRLWKSATAIRTPTSTTGECEGEHGEEHLKLINGSRVYLKLLKRASKTKRRLMRIVPPVRDLVEAPGCGVSLNALLALPGPLSFPWTCPSLNR
jgi:hypothetical protein